MWCIKIFTLICLAVVMTKAKKISDQDRELFKQMTGECKTSSEASDDDVNTIMDGKIPESKQGKCMMTCVMKQFSMFKQNDEGKQILCGSCMRKMAEMNGVEENKLVMLDEITAKCEQVTNDDECELSGDIAKCVETEVIARNLNPEDF